MRVRSPGKFLTRFLLVGIIGCSTSALGLDLQGHRGARGLAPENTLPAFIRALGVGVTTLELDLAMTRDRHAVVMHNPRFEPEIARDSSGQWLSQSSPTVHSMTLTQARAYDVGRLNPAREYASRFPEQRALDGVSVPTLEEVFELVNKAGNSAVRFNIEIKINPELPKLTFAPAEFVQTVIEVIQRFGMASRVTIQSFDWRVLREVQVRSPALTTAYLTADQRWLSNLQAGRPGASPWLAGYDIDDYAGSAARAVAAAGGDIWSPYHMEIDADSIGQAQALGLLVNVWTVNDPARMRELIAMGVDGIITDYPDRLRRLLLELGLPVPAPTPMD